MICLKPWEFPPPLKKQPVVKFVKKGGKKKKNETHTTLLHYFLLLLQWLVISQLAILHLWHLHASECQSKQFLLSKSLCLQLGKFVLMLPVTLQVQDQWVPQEPRSTSFGASCAKPPKFSLVAVSLSYWEESGSLGSKHVFQREAKDTLQQRPSQQQESWSISHSPFIQERIYEKKNQEEMPSSWAAQVPQYTRLYPPPIPLNPNFYHCGSITCFGTKIQTLPRLFSTPRSREFPLASRSNTAWAQPFSSALHALEVIQYPPDSQRFSIGFTEFWIKALKMFSCFFPPTA